MGQVLNVIILLLALIITATAGGFSAKASADSRNAPGKKYATGAAVMGLLGAILVIAAAIGYLVCCIETAKFTSHGLILALMIFALLLALGTGILAAVAATDLGSSNPGYKSAVIAAVLGLGGAGLLFLLLIIAIVLGRKKRAGPAPETVYSPADLLNMAAAGTLV